MNEPRPSQEDLDYFLEGAGVSNGQLAKTIWHAWDQTTSGGRAWLQRGIDTKREFERRCAEVADASVSEQPRVAESVIYRAIGWALEGPISTCIGWHAHPVLGIDGHMHDGGYTAHTHLPKWEWDMTPVDLEAP